MRHTWKKTVAGLAVGILCGLVGCGSSTPKQPEAAAPQPQAAAAGVTQPPKANSPAQQPVAVASTAPKTATTQPKLEAMSSLEKLSYAMGVQSAQNMKRMNVEMDVDAMVAGMKDAMSGKPLLMSDEEMKFAIALFQAELKRNQMAAKQNAAEINKAEGAAFLAQNKAKEGVVTLPDGLQYKIIKEGAGPKPTDTDSVGCRYKGTLINGTVFDGSATEDNENGVATVKLTDVIPGWREALKLMPVGAKWQIFIPSELAYGTRGAGRFIGPNATLIFDIDLVAIK